MPYLEIVLGIMKIFMDWDWEDPWISFFLALGLFIVIFYAVIILISIFSYVFSSLGLYKIAQRRHHPNPWMAWIPYASLYLYAALIDQDLVVGKKTIRNFPVWNVVYPFIIAVAYISLQIFASFSIIGTNTGGLIGSLAGSLLGLVLTGVSLTIYIYVRYRFYKKYRLDQVALFTVLSALVPLAEPIIIFIISRNPFVGEAAEGTPPPAPAPNTYPPTY